MSQYFDRSARCLLTALVGLCMLWGASAAPAESRTIDFDYDIFILSDTLAVWLDIRPVLTQAKMEDLLAGLDISIGVDLRVERPRKLFFAKTVGAAKAVIVISHPLTEDTYRLRLANFGMYDREFESQPELSDFLSDSLVLRLGPREGFEEDSDVRLSMTIISKSHSNNILENFDENHKDDFQGVGNSDKEFFESLFSFFLNLIGFGKTSYHIESRFFRLDDLSSF